MVESMGGVRARFVVKEYTRHGYEVNADFKSITRILMGLELMDRECAIKAIANILANIVDELFEVAHATSCDAIHANYAIFRIIRYYDQAIGRTYDWYEGPCALEDVVVRGEFDKKLELQAGKNWRVVIAYVNDVTDDLNDKFSAWLVMYEVDRMIYAIVISDKDGVVLTTNVCRKFIVHTDDGVYMFIDYLKRLVDVFS